MSITWNAIYVYKNLANVLAVISANLWATFGDVHVLCQCALTEKVYSCRQAVWFNGPAGHAGHGLSLGLLFLSQTVWKGCVLLSECLKHSQGGCPQPALQLWTECLQLLGTPLPLPHLSVAYDSILPGLAFLLNIWTWNSEVRPMDVCRLWTITQDALLSSHHLKASLCFIAVMALPTEV